MPAFSEAPLQALLAQYRSGMSGFGGQFTEGSGENMQFFDSAPISRTGDSAFSNGYWITGDSGGQGTAKTFKVYKALADGSKGAHNLNGTPYDEYDAQGNYLASRVFENLPNTGATDQFLKALSVAVGGPIAGQALVGLAGGAAAGGAAGAAGGAGVTVGGPMSVGGAVGTALPSMGAMGGAGGALGAAGAVGGIGGAGGAAAAGGAGILSQIGGGISSAVSALGGWGSLIAPAMSAVSGYLQNESAEDAAAAQVGAAQDGIAENRRQFDVVRGLLQPYVTAGTGALGAYQGLSGLNGAAAQQAEINMLQGSPQFGSLAKQGEDAILANASATGGLRGGNAQRSLADSRTQLLTSLIDKQLSRYGGVAQMGQQSAAGVGSAAMQTGANNAALMQQGGAAQAGGIVAGSNAITNAIGGIGGFLAGNAASAPAGGAMSPATAAAMNPNQFGTGVVPGYGLTARSF